MKIRNFVKALSGIVLIGFISTSFAAESVCPSPDQIRAKGSDFAFAYSDANFSWKLFSNAFSYNNKNWQTQFALTIPYFVTQKEAIDIGQDSFQRSPLLMEPSSTTTASKTVCLYTTANAQYVVTAETPVKYGRTA